MTSAKNTPDTIRNSSTTSASAISMTASAASPLPPVVHAIGGSIGSALAILTFYPLERIRVELQSQCANRRHNDKFDGNEGNDAGSGDDCSDIQSNNEGGKGKKGGRTNEGGKSEETRNTITSTCETDAIQYDSTENNSGITNSNPALAEESQISDVEQTILHREDASLTPHSSTGSFEVVSSPGAVDAESIEKISSGESHEESVDGPDVAAGFVGRESDDPMILSAQSSRERLPTTGTNPDIGNINHREGMREKSSGQCKHVNVDATFSQKIASSSIKFPAEVDRLTKNASTSESIMQCLLRLYKEETLYKGASHMVTTLTISNFIFFYALQVAKRSLAPFEQLDNNQEHQLRHRLFKSNAYPILFCHLSKVMPKSKMGLSLLASSLAGAINVLLTNPLWVASLRIMESKVPSTSSLSNSSSTDKSRQCNQQQNLWKVICHIARTEGILHLWNGMLVSLLLVSNPAIQHFLYGQLRTWLLEKRNDQINRRRRGRHGSGFPSITTLTPVEAFLFGALAKTGATVCTYPLQLAQVLLRLQSKAKTSTSPGSSNIYTESNISKNTDEINTTTYKGTVDCLYQQFQHGGIQALFKGMNAKLLQTVLTASFTFLTYEQTLVFVGRIYEILSARPKR